MRPSLGVLEHVLFGTRISRAIRGFLSLLRLGGDIEVLAERLRADPHKTTRAHLRARQRFPARVTTKRDAGARCLRVNLKGAAHRRTSRLTT